MRYTLLALITTLSCAWRFEAYPCASCKRIYMQKTSHLFFTITPPCLSYIFYTVWNQEGDISRFYVEDINKHNDSPGALLFPIVIQLTINFCQAMSETQFLLKVFDQSELLIYQADYGIDYGAACGDSMGPCVDGYGFKVIF
jgi:hypothetical protein